MAIPNKIGNRYPGAMRCKNNDPESAGTNPKREFCEKYNCHDYLHFYLM